MRCPMNSDEPSDDHSIVRNNTGNEVDFSEFVWMGEENLEEFDRKVELEMWEEHFIESCFEEMWREEESEAVYFDVPNQMNRMMVSEAQNVGGARPYNYPAYQQHPQPNHLYLRQPMNVNFNDGAGQRDLNSQQGTGQRGDQDLSAMMGSLSVQERNGINQAMSSKLNPNAAVFIPRSLANSTPPTTSTASVDR